MDAYVLCVCVFVFAFCHIALDIIVVTITCSLQNGVVPPPNQCSTAIRALYEPRDACTTAVRSAFAQRNISSLFDPRTAIEGCLRRLYNIVTYCSFWMEDFVSG